MRLSHPLLLASLGVLFISVSCTLVTDVDRSKIPDGTADGGVPSVGGSVTNPPVNNGGAGGEVTVAPGNGGAGGEAVTVPPSAGGPNTDGGGAGGASPQTSGGAGGATEADAGGAGGATEPGVTGGAAGNAGAAQ